MARPRFAGSFDWGDALRLTAALSFGARGSGGRVDSQSSHAGKLCVCRRVHRGQDRLGMRALGVCAAGRKPVSTSVREGRSPACDLRTDSRTENEKEWQGRKPSPRHKGARSHATITTADRCCGESLHALRCAMTLDCSPTSFIAREPISFPTCPELTAAHRVCAGLQLKPDDRDEYFAHKEQKQPADDKAKPSSDKEVRIGIKPRRDESLPELIDVPPR